MFVNQVAAVTSLFLFLGLAISAQGVSAQTLLTVTHEGQVIEYDIDALETLGSVTIETSTIWTDGPQTFTGVPLASLVAELALEDGVLLASAINDYTVEIPISDAVGGGPIVAYLNNSELMSVRDKGPLWIIYPYDSNPAYQSELIYSRSIWQLDRIETSN